MLLLELCSLGNLKDLLRSECYAPADPEEMVRFCVDVANGMAFVEPHGLLHRDLAARNVVVTAARVCKVTDFGLSRWATEDKDYYRRSEASPPIPVRWVAPECLLYGIATPSGDRWAFGVLAWEVFNRGARPYAALGVEDVLGFLQSGKRLGTPAGCPPGVQELMSECWAADPDDRPSFGGADGIVRRLELEQAGQAHTPPAEARGALA